MQKFSWICFPASFSSKLVPNKLVNSCFFSINAFRPVSLKFDTVVRFSYLWGNEEIELGEWRIMQSSWLDFSCIKIQIWKGQFKLLISSPRVSKLLNKQAKCALRFLIPLKPQVSIRILSYEKYPSCIHTLGSWIWRFSKELKYRLSPRFFFMPAYNSTLLKFKRKLKIISPIQWLQLPSTQWQSALAGNWFLVWFCMADFHQNTQPKGYCIWGNHLSYW